MPGLIALGKHAGRFIHNQQMVVFINNFDIVITG